MKNIFYVSIKIYFQFHDSIQIKFITKCNNTKDSLYNSLSQHSDGGVGSGGSGGGVGSGLSPRPGTGLAPRGGAG